MTFLAYGILFGLALAAIPVIIHLLNRRKARVIDWGAMRFLEFSLATRGRRILIEEILLLAVRTLLIVALVLAAARPLLVNRYFARGGQANQDVVILLDGSMSMGAAPVVGQDTYFEAGRSAARRAIERLRPGDAVAVVLAAAAPHPLTQQLTYDRKAANDALDRALLTDGTLDVPAALEQAAKILAQGRNPNKRIVLISDGRSHGWRVNSEEAWQSVAREFADAKSPPLLTVLRLAAHEGASESAAESRVANLAVEQVRLTRPVVGTHMPIKLEVVVRNTGDNECVPEVLLALRPALSRTPAVSEAGSPPPAPGKPGADIIATAALPVIQAHQQATVQIETQFSEPGPHLLRVELTNYSDRLDADNRLDFAVGVLDSLPVLLVDGDPGDKPENDELFNLKAAFQPQSEPGERQMEFLVRPTVIGPAILGNTTLGDYQAIVLANVDRLADGDVARLKEFVANGGGLLVAPGDKADLKFYNDVLYADGQGLLPSALAPAEAIRQPAPAAAGSPDPAAPKEAVTLMPPPTGHPALIECAAATWWQNVRENRHYPLTAPADKPADGRETSVVLQLSDGRPFALDRGFEQGRVVLMGGPLDTAWSPAPSRVVYVLLVNELMHYLSAARRAELNVQPGQTMAIPLPQRADSATAATIATPGGEHFDLTRVREGDRWVYRFDRTLDPGVYTVRYSGLTDVADPTEKLCEPAVVHYTVVRDAGESTMDLLDGTARDEIGKMLGGAQFPAETGEMLDTMSDYNPGRELWRWLVAAAMALLLLEILLSGHITRSRHGELTGGVSFGEGVKHTHVVR
ncbi:MAG: hypothetical protein BIFFINMI_02553 [Phycisphaerae bacterium]|nr:hypothetical protein [Phycisphaerae bacterium]